MQVDVETSGIESEPINLLYLMDKAILTTLLNGHCFAISAGLSVLFKKVREIPNIEQIDRIDALSEKAKDVFYPLCKYFRSKKGCGCDQVCQEFDKEVTLKYYTGYLAGPRLYRCPLQLWDMTYPLCVKGNILGVLFGGQVVVKEDNVNWPEVLEKIKDQVVWCNFTEVGNQVEDICGAIKSMKLTVEQETRAKTIVRGESKKNRKNVSVKTLLKRYEDFLEFGQMMEALLERFYELIHLPERSRFAQVLTSLHEINANILSEATKIQTLEHIAKSAQKVFGADSCIIWEYDQTSRSFMKQPSTGLHTNWRELSPKSDGIGSQVIKSGQHLYVEDDKFLHRPARYEGIVWSGGFPLQSPGTEAKPVGVLYLHFKKRPHFNDNDLKMVDLFSYNAGLAIQLAELREKNETRIKYLEALRSANVSVAKAKNLKDSLKQVVKAAVKVMHADAAIVYPYDEETGTFKKDLVISVGINMKKFEFQDPRPGGLTYTLMERAESLWEKDFEKVPKEREKLIKKLTGHVLLKYRLRSFGGIALRSGEDKLGVLYVFFQKQHEPNAEELSTINIFADLAATQIQLAKLSEAKKRAAEADEIALSNLITAQFAHRLANVAGTIPLVVQDIEERLQAAKVTDNLIWSRLGDLNNDIKRLLEMADHCQLSEVGSLVRVDLKSVVQEAIKGASLQLINSGINVNIDIPHDLKAVMGVQALLVDMLINLLQNAAQANAKTIQIQAIGREKMTDVIVSDDGDGIPEKETEKVFMPFYTTRKSGREGKPHGRGLWVARHQIGQMGGRITARNRPSKGACFTVSLKKFNG